MVIKDDEHVFIAGSTGSGKTYFVKNYAANIPGYVFVLDSKGTFEWEQIPDDKQITIENLSEIFQAVEKFKKIIYRPVFEELTPHYFNEFLKFCYFFKNCTVLIDETMQVCPNPFKIPDFYKAILTRGRELHVSIWSLTQRPSMIPVVVYSEATHMFIFQLVHPDRKKLAEFTGFKDFEQNLKKYHFWYYNTRTNERPVIGVMTTKRKGGENS